MVLAFFLHPMVSRSAEAFPINSNIEAEDFSMVKKGGTVNPWIRAVEIEV